MSEINPVKFIVDNTELIIRTAQVTDAEKLLDYTKFSAEDSKYLLRASSEEFTLTVEQEKEWIQKNLDHENSVVIICMAGDELISITDARGGARQRISHIAGLGTSVAKKWRGKGIGKAMMKELCNWAKANKTLEFLELSVMGDNHVARSLYKSLGFVKIAEKPKAFKYEDGTYQTDIIMRLSLT